MGDNENRRVYEARVVKNFKELLDYSCKNYASNIAYKYKRDYTSKNIEYIEKILTEEPNNEALRKKIARIQAKKEKTKIFDEKDQQHSSLSDVLMGTVSWKQAIFRNEKTGFWQLFQYHPIAQPGSVMSGDRLSELLKQLQKDMDYIVVDCSPVAVAADAEIWMHHVDTAVVVVRQDTSDVRIINDTVDLIWKSVKDFSGFVLNAFHKDPVQSAGRGYYAE